MELFINVGPLSLNDELSVTNGFCRLFFGKRDW
jgi:hypothetical protein